jgi:hypothetical protein
MMTPSFQKLELNEKQKLITKWSRLAHTHGFKVLFWGSTLGLKEHGVVVFDSNGSPNKFLKYKREWLALGTPDAGKYIVYVRIVTVH